MTRESDLANRARRQATHEVWRMGAQARLNAMPAMVAAEVDRLARDRHNADQAPAITRQDVAICEGRVVSRLRLKTYGRLPDDPEEAIRQTNEIRASLGLNPIPARKAAA